MKKWFDKDEVWFAVGWIVVYVLGFGNADSLSEAIGMPKVLTVCVGLLLSLVLIGFIRKNRLWDYLGLCAFKGSARSVLYWIPLILMSSVNLWYGLTLNETVGISILHVISMCFVGFLEEVIFRGLLFKGMSKTNLRAAIVVSSLTFGVGHAVNLLFGEPVFETLLQLIYASAIGFCYTAIFYAGGSIVPCILSHALINSMSVFAVEPSAAVSVAVAAVQTVVSVGYGLWVLREGKKSSVEVEGVNQ